MHPKSESEIFRSFPAYLETKAPTLKQKRAYSLPIIQFSKGQNKKIKKKLPIHFSKGQNK